MQEKRAILHIPHTEMLALKPIEVPFIRLWGHEKEITFSSGYEDEFPAAISYLADRRVKVEKLISERIELDDLVEKGITPLIEEPGRYIKVLVYPGRIPHAETRG